jgi:hypothetical protein
MAITFTLNPRLQSQNPKSYPMSWNAIFGVASIVSFFFPVAVIISYRLYQHRSLAALLINYALTAIYLLISENIISASDSFATVFWMIINYLDVPLMLTALLFFCPVKQKQNRVHLVTLAFVVYEIVITCIHGFTTQSIIYIMGPGMIVVLGYSFYLFGRQIRFTIIHGKNAGRTLMLASILFFYGCYGLVYYFFYIEKTKDTNDAMLLYFIGSFIACMLMGAGLLMMRRRIKELRSIRVTRKELALFFQ